MFQIQITTNLVDYNDVMRVAVVETARNIRERSRKDIAGSMHNGGRWARGLETNIKKQENSYRIGVYLKPGFLHGFEYGMTSVGKPYLMLPLAPNKIKLRKFGGKLIMPKGKRVLIRPHDGRVMYVGVSSITNRQRFHLRTIAEDEAQKFPQRLVETAAHARKAAA